MERKELSKQIGELNIKIFSASKELEEMELNVKRKKIEIRKYKNEVKGLQLKLEEIEIEKWRERKNQKEVTKKQKPIDMRYKEDTNPDYYSQNKKFNDIGNVYADYMEKNILPYND